MGKHVVRIPVISGRGKIKLPEEGKLVEIIACELYEVDGNVSKTYATVKDIDSMSDIQWRGIYLKGHKESTQIGGIFLSMKDGEYMMSLPNLMTRPAGLDMVITLSTVEEEACA